MKTIIVGTDFSPSSINASKYAALLASQMKCKLTIFNLFEAPLIHSNIGLYGLSFLSLKKSSEKKMQGFSDELQSIFPKLKIEVFVTSGNFKTELENFTSKHQVAAAVMGLEAKNWISDAIYGSHGVNIAGKIETPVIIVPLKYKKHKFSELLLAVDNQEKMQQTKLIGMECFLKSTKVKIKALHVRTLEEVFKSASSKLRINEKTLPIQEINANDLSSGIKKYCKKAPVDLVCVISRKHSIFYNLYAESNTNYVAFTSNIPVMAIHE